MSGTIKGTMGLVEWAMLLFLSLIWGGSFFFNAVALRGFEPLTVVALRVAIGAAALWFIAVAMGFHVPREGVLWRRFLAMGCLNNAVPFSLIVWGQTHIASGLASILNATTPLFTVVIAHSLLKDERLTMGRLGGVVVGLLGVTLMVGPDAFAQFGSGVLAELAVLGASLAYALASVYARRFAGIPPMVTAAGQVTGSSLIMIPLALAVDRPWLASPAGWDAWAAIAGIGVVSTALAYVVYFSILRRAGATNLMLVTLLIPPSAIALGALFLDETLGPLDYAGLLSITAGLALIDGRLLRLLAGRRGHAQP